MTQKNDASHPKAASAQENHIAVPIVSNAGANSKRWQTLRAELALLGITGRECVEGGFFLSRWNLTRYCRELTDVEAFIREVQK